ncbi:TIGR03986 family CRISPR-associated RAMP protein [Zoogloea sp.]|uniref:TIGR03986 family type III CRISPR-associated RAMP protein n=1 Tax=Zoogloea sp. TaxID=49181 RepID=UPI0035AE7265
MPFSQPDIDRWLSPNAHREAGGHSRYRGLSGRLVCALTTVTPLFVGAAAGTPASDQHPKPVAGFTLQNQPAIPATSLRGLLSSLFESISGSNLRVLHPTPYSIRKPMEHALSAIGRIVERNGERNGELKLYPLTLPTIHQNAYKAYPVPARWRKVFDRKSTVPLRVYFGNRRETYDARQPYYLKIRELNDLPNPNTNQRDLRFPNGDRNRAFLIGQHPLSERPITEERPHYTRGWVRSLWTPNREKELPRTVKHQLFIPDPVETPADDDLLPIPQGVLDTFHALADLALAGQHWGKDDTPADDRLLPFTPAGRPAREDGRETRLQPGDLVCFDLDNNGAVSEISFSSIWRQGLRKAGRPELATTADLLAQVSPHLLPLGMPGRSERLSPVEQLFGVVEYRPPQAAKGTRKPTDAPAAYALAGKVHVGYGRPARSFERAPAVTLKELSTPKPPSPALYFRPKAGDGYVSKADLARQPQNYAPAGRKHYLHALRRQGQVAQLDDYGRAPGDGSGRPPWQSRFDGQEDSGNKRRVRVEPIPAGETFHFEIDFDNLNPTELEQLCATLLPHPAFEHRLGMGKPIGLGSVKLAVEGLLLVDRPRRYAEDEPNAPRHHRGWRANADAGWPDHLQGDSPAAPLEAAEQPAAQAERAMARVPADVRRALQLLGNPGAVAAPVHYPQVKDAQIEKEHYLWFVANDDKNTVGGNRHLPRLHADSRCLPTLPRLVKREKDHPPNTGKPRRK